MLTNDETRMLRTVAAYNGMTEGEAVKAIVRDYLETVLKDETSPIGNMKLQPIEKQEEPKEAPAPAPWPAQAAEMPKKRKKPGPKPRKMSVNEIADEIEQTESYAKMTKDEFIDYMSRRQALYGD